MSELSTACPFCAIARGEDREAEIVCEGPLWVAFFPRQPATTGHTLVIPRVHVADLWAADAATAAALIGAAQLVGHAVTEAVSPEGLNLITSAGAAASQTVDHLHLHVVPRWNSDPIGRIWPPARPMAEDLKAETARRIRSACQRLR